MVKFVARVSAGYVDVHLFTVTLIYLISDIHLYLSFWFLIWDPLVVWFAFFPVKTDICASFTLHLFRTSYFLQSCSLPFSHSGWLELLIQKVQTSFLYRYEPANFERPRFLSVWVFIFFTCTYNCICLYPSVIKPIMISVSPFRVSFVMHSSSPRFAVTCLGFLNGLVLYGLRYFPYNDSLSKEQGVIFGSSQKHAHGCASFLIPRNCLTHQTLQSLDNLHVNTYSF